jgi:hypothetical protein
MNTPEIKPNSGRKLFFGLFVFPLVIAVGMALLLCSVVLLTNEKETPETLVAAIKTGSPAKRWQKAYELSNELNRKKEDLMTDAVMREIAAIYSDAARYDAKTRAYMAVALSHFRSSEAAAALNKGLSDTDRDVRLYSIWSLGTMNAHESAPAIAAFLSDEDADLRKTAVYVLGAFQYKEGADRIRALLKDPVQDVRWNAALALARTGDASGKPTLFEMLDRAALSEVGLDETAAEGVMINATKGLALINDPDSIKILESLSREDKSLKVRQAAMDAIDYQKNMAK